MENIGPIFEPAILKACPTKNPKTDPYLFLIYITNVN